MSLKNIKTAAALQREKADAARDAQRQAELRARNRPENIAELVDRVSVLESKVAALEGTP